MNKSFYLLIERGVSDSVVDPDPKLDLNLIKNHQKNNI
jgi:hypothetical protein